MNREEVEIKVAQLKEKIAKQEMKLERFRRTASSSSVKCYAPQIESRLEVVEATLELLCREIELLESGSKPENLMDFEYEKVYLEQDFESKVCACVRSIGEEFRKISTIYEYNTYCEKENKNYGRSN